MKAHYPPGKLQKVLSAVRQRRKGIRTAARELGIPRSTLYDQLKDRPKDNSNRKKLSKLLSV